MMNPATLSIIAATFPPRQRGIGDRDLGRRLGPRARDRPARRRPDHRARQLELDLLHQRPDRRRSASSTPLLDRRVARHVARAAPRRSRARDLGIGLFALTYALIEANTYGWSVDRILGSFARRGRSLVAFVLLELRQRLPMLDLSLFRNGTFAGANTWRCSSSARDVRRLLLRLALHAEHPRLLADAGRRVVPADDVLIILIAPSAGQLSDRFGSRWLMGGGMALLAVSLLSTRASASHATFWTLLPALILGGIGMALTMSPMTAAAMGSVPVDKAGVGSAVLNSLRQVGGSLGIAVMGAIVASASTLRRTRSALRRTTSTDSCRSCGRGGDQRSARRSSPRSLVRTRSSRRHVAARQHAHGDAPR